MGSVARAVVSTKVSRIGNRYAAQVGADPDDNEPLRVLGAYVVVFWVTQGFHCDGLFGANLGACPVM